MTLDCHHLPVALKVCVKCVFCPFVLPTMRVLQVCCQGPSRGTPTELDLEKVNVRGREFSELLSHWRVPLDTGNFIASTSIGPGTCTCRLLKRQKMEQTIEAQMK